MNSSLLYRLRSFSKLSLATLAIGCLVLLSACNNAKEVTDESTLGSNNAAQTNPDKIERNSMDNVAEARAEDDQIAIAEADK